MELMKLSTFQDCLKQLSVFVHIRNLPRPLFSFISEYVIPLQWMLPPLHQYWSILLFRNSVYIFTCFVSSCVLPQITNELALSKSSSSQASPQLSRKRSMSEEMLLGPAMSEESRVWSLSHQVKEYDQLCMFIHMRQM